MKKFTFLVDVGVEELPPKILKRLGQDFLKKITDELKRNNICYVQEYWFASARHLAVKLIIIIQKKQCNDFFDVSSSQIDLNNMYCSGTMSGKVSSIVKQDVSEYSHSNINDYYYLHDLLYQVVHSALIGLKNYTMMRWDDAQFEFIRPVRRLTVLLDAYLITGNILGVDIDRILYGNQCMNKCEIILDDANNYPEILIKQGWVMVDYNKRKNLVCLEIEKEAKKLGGFVNIKDNGLFLEEITALVEWPVILSGKFNKKFLNLPHEVIVHIMQYNQKYFPVYNMKDGTLLPNFIFVANALVKDYHSIILNHESVIISRLMDAEFFLKKDNQKRLEDYIDQLDSVLFHRKLGTLRDKVLRIEILSGWIASQIGVSVSESKRAGYLCKCDLMSSMVYEFPSTQGVIGMYYAKRDGESYTISLAQKEHYFPRFSSDVLPDSYISCAVSIADKIDTISGMFGAQEIPKGSRDPFALRRSAFGILRILIEKKFPIDLLNLIQKSVGLYENRITNIKVVNDIYVFIYKRLYSWFSLKGYSLDIIRAVLTQNLLIISDIDSRISAIKNFCHFKSQDMIQLCSMYKRISKILVQREMMDNKEIEEKFLKQSEEIHLYDQIKYVEGKIDCLFEQKRYYDFLLLLSTLLGVVNNFFRNVVVMDKENIIQINRLVLLSRIKKIFLKIMDFSLFHMS